MEPIALLKGRGGIYRIIFFKRFYGLLAINLQYSMSGHSTIRLFNKVKEKCVYILGLTSSLYRSCKNLFLCKNLAGINSLV